MFLDRESCCCLSNEKIIMFIDQEGCYLFLDREGCYCYNDLTLAKAEHIYLPFLLRNN